MPRPKNDKRLCQSVAKTRKQVKNRANYQKYKSDNKQGRDLKSAVAKLVNSPSSFRVTAAKHHVPKSTLHQQVKEAKEKGEINLTSKRMQLLSAAEEDVVEHYVL